MNYLVLFFGLFSLLFAFIKWAERKKLHDLPNERSSHKIPTPTAGGFVIVLGVFGWGVYYQSFSADFMGCLGILAVIGIIDDFKDLPTSFRLVIHLIITGFMVWSFRHDYEFTLLLILTLTLIFTAWINVFNFMDGINGIAGLYALVFLTTFWFVNDQIVTFMNPELIITSGIGILVFGYFNFRSNAKIFAGDVGSISMAFILGYLILNLILVSQNILFLLFFAVFAVDSGLTIFSRLLKGENILKPHRQHLYQYLVNQKGYSHLLISGIYCGLQAIINIGLILVQERYSVLTEWVYSITTVLILVIAYFSVKKLILNSELDKLRSDE